MPIGPSVGCRVWPGTAWVLVDDSGGRRADDGVAAWWSGLCRDTEL